MPISAALRGHMVEWPVFRLSNDVTAEVQIAAIPKECPMQLQAATRTLFCAEESLRAPKQRRVLAIMATPARKEPQDWGC